jgi:hypothetical protein
VAATGSSAATVSLKIKSFSDLSAAQGSAGRQAAAATAGGGAPAHWTKVEGRPIQDTGRVYKYPSRNIIFTAVGSQLEIG